MLKALTALLINYLNAEAVVCTIYGTTTEHTLNLEDTKIYDA